MCASSSSFWKVFSDFPESVLQLCLRPSPVMDSSGKKYKPQYAFKTELSKAPPVLPKAPKSPGKPDKKLDPGFQMSLDKVRGFAKCNECGKPQVVYSKLKVGGNDILYFKQKLGNIQSKLWDCDFIFFQEGAINCNQNRHC